MTSRTRRLPLSQENVERFCKQARIRRLALFGSYLDERFGPESDIDVLVEFEPGHVPGLGFFVLQDELSRLVGRRVELHTPSFLSPRFRDRVLAEAQVQYAQG